MLLGRNGADKTTTLRTLMGLWRASQGALDFAGSPVKTLPADMARRGIAYVPENMGIFAGLSVKENLLLAGAIGAVLGAILFVFAQRYLQDGLHVLHEAVSAAGLVAPRFEPDRWLLWLGVLFVLSVYYFPGEITGKLRR